MNAQLNDSLMESDPIEEPITEPITEPIMEPLPEDNDKASRMEVIRSNIPVEPKSQTSSHNSSIGGDIVRIRVIYPNGTKLQRNFLPSDPVSLLYKLVELDIFENSMGIDSFQLCATMSKDCIESVCEFIQP